MSVLQLPYDIARCRGEETPLCHGCRRLEPGNPDGMQWYVEPAMTLYGCEKYIHQEDDGEKK